MRFCVHGSQMVNFNDVDDCLSFCPKFHQCVSESYVCIRCPPESVYVYMSSVMIFFSVKSGQNV